VDELALDGEVSVGRTVHNVIRLAETSVSGKHAKIVLDDSGCWLVDLESHNGTLLDGARIPAGERQQLNGGERIGVGSYELTYVPPPRTQEIAREVLDPSWSVSDVLPPPAPTRRRSTGRDQLIALAIMLAAIGALAAVILPRVW
jgi:pSer/pThr/pTyr-binding forkhead associated (FHA) protein